MNKEISKTIDIFSEEDLKKIICQWSSYHPHWAISLLNSRGIKTCNDIIERDDFNGIGKHSLIADILRGLDAHGYRRSDCSVERYPNIDDYFRDYFVCSWCGEKLDSESNTKLLLCEDCSKRCERINSPKNLRVSLDIVADEDEDEDEEDTQDIKEINVVVTIENNLQIPINLKLNSFTLWHNKMQFLRDCDWLDECCIHPGKRKILKGTWSGIKRRYSEDYFIISFSDLTHNKEYVYKFGTHYSRNDYWEADLSNRIIKLESIKKNAIRNMVLLGFSKAYIDDFRKDGTVCLIEGKKKTPINENNMPELYKKIKSLEQTSNSMVYAVFNEPDLFDHESTNIFHLLCAYDNDIELGKIYKKEKISKLIAYSWDEDTGNSEHSIVCFQQTDSDVLCLPHELTRFIAPNIE